MKWTLGLTHILKSPKWVHIRKIGNNVSRIYTNGIIKEKPPFEGEKKEPQKMQTIEKTEKEYILSLDEALYLSKEMGIKTTTELQRIIMRSPPFSADTSPFVIENFLRNVRTDKIDNSTEELLNTEKQIEELESEKEKSDEKEEGIGEFSISNNMNDNNDLIRKILINNFNKKKKNTFIHDEREWLEESEGIGTNKRSCAYVYLKRGSGIIKINNEEDFYIRWPYIYNRIDVIEPFHLTNTTCVYDVFIKLKGGGVSGQARAARLAIGRALLNACPYVHDILVENDVLYEDVRQKMPKMPGRRKARAMKQWSKR